MPLNCQGTNDSSPRPSEASCASCSSCELGAVDPGRRVTRAWKGNEVMKRRRKEPTVAEVINLYLNAQELRFRSNALSKGSVVRSNNYLGSFRAKYGHQRISDCHRADIVTWLLEHPSWESSHTKISAVGQVVACFRWAEDDELIERSPYRRPRALWAPPQPRQALLPEEYEAIMTTARGCRTHPTRLPVTTRRRLRREQWRHTIHHHISQHRGPLFLFPCPADQWRRVMVVYHAHGATDYIRVEVDESTLIVVATMPPPLSIYAREVNQSVAIERLLAALPPKAKGGQRQFSSSYGWKLLPLAHAGNGNGGAPQPHGRDRAHPGRTAFRIALWLLWNTGARTCELRNATFSDVDWETSVIRLTDHKTTRATGLDRIIALNRRVMRLVRWLHKHRRPEQQNIIINSRGRPWVKGTFSQQFKRFALMAGIQRRVSPYSARHGFTVRAIELGMGERQIADLLGHASTIYVSYYGKSTRNKLDYLCNLADQL